MLMKKSALALTTALSLMAFAPAFAEDMSGVDPNCIMKNADGTETVDMAKCPDGKTMAKTDSSAAQPSDEMNSGPSTSTTTAEQPADAAATPGAPTASTIVVPADIMSGATLMSASDYIGKRVYDTAGNDIGEVNDLILSNDGKIQATILGVGGFLGIGEKDVAVPVSSVEMVKDGDSVKLVVNATKDQLEQAPTFDPKTRNYAG